MPLVEQALALSRERFGPDHWRTGEAQLALGIVLTATGQSARAEPLLRQAAATIQPHRRAQPRLALQLDAALIRGKACSARCHSSLALLRRLLWTTRASIGTGGVRRRRLHNSHVISQQIHTQSRTIGADRTYGGSRPWADSPAALRRFNLGRIMNEPGRFSRRHSESTKTSAAAAESGDISRGTLSEDLQPQVRAVETRLLYENANTGVAITVVIATLLAYAHWDVVSHAVVVPWLLYMLVVSLGRFALAQRYWRASSTGITNRKWNTAFVVGTALAAAGWGAGPIALYRSSSPMNDVLLVFVIGGVMLGSASLLAARPEAFLTFLLPTGLVTSWRVASQGDEQHLIMGFLGAVFTVATIITTWRFHLAIESSFTLRFANQNLIESLQKAKDDTDALNRELEFRVGDRTAKLLEADQRKDEFLATLAHELRNPLAPIRFALETLKGDAPQATAERARDVIERQVTQLVRLVDDLLDVSRITANKIQLRREPLDLARLMATAVESITPLATASGHTLDVQLPAQPICIDGDGARLVQVFANVLNNAVKFTPRDGHIWFTADRQSDVAIVRIRDTGVGIAADVLPRVFDMFHQAEPVLERSTGGLGIGLTLGAAVSGDARRSDRHSKSGSGRGNRS